MNTKIFEGLINRINILEDIKEEIIQLNRNEKAFIDEDKKSIELAEAIFEKNSMFCFRNPHNCATEYILRKIISDRDLFDKMKNRGTNIIRLFSLVSKYNEHFGYHSISALKVTECGILNYSNNNIVPLEDTILTHPSLYLRLTVFNDKNPHIRKRLTKDLIEDKTKLDIFLNGILATSSSDLVLSCINKIQWLNEEDRNYFSCLQKKNMLDLILNKDGKTLAKIAIKELLKLSILQEKESTKLESPKISSVKTHQHCNA